MLTEIYAASEDKIPGVDSAGLAEAIRSHGHRNASHVADLDAVLEHLTEVTRPGDLVITLGAGNISTLAPRLLERLGGA